MKTDCKQCEHCGDRCFCPPDKYCTAFKKKKVYVKHTFEFRTKKDWKPMTSACWVDCPFSFMIGLGKSCKCLDENNELECPFIGNCYDDI